MKLTKIEAGQYETKVKGQTIEIHKGEFGQWFISNEPYAYFETLKGVRTYLEKLERE